MAEKNTVNAQDENDGAVKGFSLKKRKPAYVAAALVIISLLVIYLLSVYHNKHENSSPLPPKTMTKPTE